MNNDFSNSNPATSHAVAEEKQFVPPIASIPLWKRVESYTVQQAAALSGLSEHTLRYYEKIGLINPVHRQASSGHRRYGPTELIMLEAIACLRATGMPIDQMRRYLELRAEGGNHADAAELQVLLSAHLEELHRRMADLQKHIEYVGLKIQYWRAYEAHDEQAAAAISQEAQKLARALVQDRE